MKTVANPSQRLRLGFVGGGLESSIGATHRYAAQLDGHFELVAGVFARDPARNRDGKPLEADHSQARSKGGTKADRLLCSTCNRSRQAGDRDHQRPALRERPRPQAFPWPGQSD